MTGAPYHVQFQREWGIPFCLHIKVGIRFSMGLSEVAVHTSVCIHTVKQLIYSVSHVAAISVGAELCRSTSHKLTGSSAKYILMLNIIH